MGGASSASWASSAMMEGIFKCVLLVFSCKEITEITTFDSCAALYYLLSTIFSRGERSRKCTSSAAEDNMISGRWQEVGGGRLVAGGRPLRSRLQLEATYS